MTLPDTSVPYTPDDGIGFAGVCLQAADTGRILMLQRSLADPEDPNAGLWEFPGGALEDGEDPWAGAQREFGEEVGIGIPEDAQEGASWDLPPDSPKYRLFLVTIPSEASIDLNSNALQNPDDPHGLNREAVAFWDPQHVQGDNIRPEVLDTMKTVGDTLTTPTSTTVAAASPPAPPFTKKSAPPVNSKVPVTDESESAEQKALALLAKAADMATDPALKKLITDAEAELQPPADSVAAAAPPAPPDASSVDTAPATPEEKVADLLQQIKAVHQGHMDGTVPDNAASQQSLLDLIDAAHELVCPTDKSQTTTPADAMIASAAPMAPPDEWFQPFDLEGATPLTVTADGRVFGHLATWDSCHRSGQYANKCTRPPSDPKAPFFQMGQVLTASGATVDVGLVTVGGGHASPNKGLIAALEHYDDVSTAAATVTVHEDDYGIGLFGSVVPDADPAMVAALRRSPLSGDWRKEKGKWRLVAAHAVNTPGFPIPRGLVASVEGEAFFTTGRVEPKQPVIDLRAAAQRLAKSAGLDTESMVASARQSMAEIDCGCDDEESSLVASVIGDTSLPISSYDLGWDGGEAGARMFDHFTDASGKVDVAGVAKGYLWRDETHPADEKSGYGLPFADIVNGELQTVPSGVQACAGGHGVGQLKGASPQEIAEIKGKIGELYAAIQAKYPDAPSNPYDKTGA